MTKEFLLQTIFCFLTTWLYSYALSGEPWLSCSIAALMAMTSIIVYCIDKKGKK